MNFVKNKFLSAIFQIVILLCSLSVCLLDALVPLNFWTHPVLNFFFCVFSGFGLYYLILGLKNNSAWSIFIALVLLCSAGVYALLQYLAWWLTIIIIFIFCAISLIISSALLGVKTEEVLNDKPEYKDYKQRLAEVPDTEEEQEQLPEIKSFK